ncbi:hypothetical protein CJF32_00008733 [Rutstroemia sp. NJR-2017a WRK4]|nr:hypothetical protein CJF32_00008733 [Rutstroemia sp. NJR-2017a WRK4]
MQVCRIAQLCRCLFEGQTEVSGSERRPRTDCGSYPSYLRIENQDGRVKLFSISPGPDRRVEMSIV